MPNKHSIKSLVSVLAGALLLAACAITPADPAVLASAEAALARAEAAGAEVHAPREIRRARARLEAAAVQIENRRGAAAARLADEAEIDAQLALAKTRAAREQEELMARREALEQLESNLRAEYGDEMELP